FVYLGRRVVSEHTLGAGGEGAHVQGQHDVLGDHFAVTVEDGAAGVLGFSDDGGEAGAKQRVLHLLDDAGQARLNYLQGDGINFHNF
ncbi:MAG: hypothetical protein AAB070_03065, partial [Candidatus Binatota bacterium]